jgi:CheY-like chemotaxis protein
VTIYLPLLDGAAIARSIPPGLGPIEGSERILVVDDEPFIVDLLATRLTTLGYSVTALTDSLDALVRIEKDPSAFDVVITDQVMPKLTGLALLGRIKALRPTLPVILCTGFSNDVTEELVILAGASGFFQKPVSADQLARRIRELFASPAALARNAERRPAARRGS